MSDSSAPDENEVGLAYGSLFMHQGEKVGKAEEQVYQLSKKQPVAWFFDIVHTRNQTPAAGDMMVKVVQLIHKAMPELKDENIIVRASLNGKPRLALAAAAQISDGIKDVKAQK